MKFRNIITSVLTIAAIAAGSLQFPASVISHGAADGGEDGARRRLRVLLHRRQDHHLRRGNDHRR